jgi:hypothetical protein
MLRFIALPWLLRYGIDAAVHEFNCNWIEGSRRPARIGVRMAQR